MQSVQKYIDEIQEGWAVAKQSEEQKALGKEGCPGRKLLTRHTEFNETMARPRTPAEWRSSTQAGGGSWSRGPPGSAGCSAGICQAHPKVERRRGGWRTRSKQKRPTPGALAGRR